jgi:hypothetical protein
LQEFIAATPGPLVAYEKRLAAVDGWTRIAQILLWIGAIAAFILFFLVAIADTGMREKAIVTSLTAKTGDQKAGSKVTREVTLQSPGSAGTGADSAGQRKEVTTTEATPRMLSRKIETERPSDTIITLMGAAALGLALAAATLPRLKSLEFQGFGLVLKDAESDAEAAAAAKQVVQAAIAQQTMAPATAAQWAEAAVSQTMRKAQAARLAAALTGDDPTEAKLSDADVRAIVQDTRPP